MNALERRCAEINRMPDSEERRRLAAELQADINATYRELDDRRIRTNNRVLGLLVGAVVLILYFWR